MSTEYQLPHIPESLTPYFDEDAQIVHEYMASKSLEEFLKEKPESRVVSSARIVELPPVVEEDEGKSFVLILPFAQGWKHSMFLRARHYQRTVAPNHRLFVLPGDTKDEPAFDLNEEEREKVRSGDFTPIAEHRVRALRNLALGEVAISAYSAGGTEAPFLAQVLADYAELSSININEATNTESRLAKQLKKDFTGSNPLSAITSHWRAIRNAKVPAINEALGILPLAGDYMHFALDASTKDNKAIQHGMASNNSSSVLAPVLRAQQQVSAFYTNAQNSRITRTEPLRIHVNSLKQEFGNRVEMLTVEGYGHEMGDNIVVHALLGKAALARAKK